MHELVPLRIMCARASKRIALMRNVARTQVNCNNANLVRLEEQQQVHSVLTFIVGLANSAHMDASYMYIYVACAI